jgi:hypothetical protein
MPLFGDEAEKEWFRKSGMISPWACHPQGGGLDDASLVPYLDPVFDAVFGYAGGKLAGGLQNLGVNQETSYRITAGAFFVASIATAKSGSVAKGGTKATQTGRKELYNFGKTAGQHMTEPGRRVPLQLMDDVIKTTKGLPDPGGSNALMYYSPMWKNGKVYNFEVLYDQTTNSIWHFNIGKI